MHRSADRGDVAATYRAVGGVDAPLAFSEVKQLWWFLDGSIMSPDTRRRLWRSWGFCPRHTWAHAVVECELRVQPFSTAILYEDLTARAARALRRPGPAALVTRRLEARAACVTCDYLKLPASDGDEPFFVERWRRANRLERIRELLAVSHATWLPRSCPACTGRKGRPAGRTCSPGRPRPPGGNSPESWMR